MVLFRLVACLFVPPNSGIKKIIFHRGSLASQPQRFDCFIGTCIQSDEFAMDPNFPSWGLIWGELVGCGSKTSRICVSKVHFRKILSYSLFLSFFHDRCIIMDIDFGFFCATYSSNYCLDFKVRLALTIDSLPVNKWIRI